VCHLVSMYHYQCLDICISDGLLLVKLLYILAI